MKSMQMKNEFSFVFDLGESQAGQHWEIKETQVEVHKPQVIKEFLMLEKKTNLSEQQKVEMDVPTIDESRGGRTFSYPTH